MEEVEREADLCTVEPGVLLGQPPLPLHVEHEVAAAHELDHEEQPRRRLEDQSGGSEWPGYVVDQPKIDHISNKTIYPIIFTNKLTNGTRNWGRKLTIYPI